jgi:isoamylase
MKLQPGSDYPLGATCDGAGTNFSVFSAVAERVELCLFDAGGDETRFDLPEVTAFCWHGYLPAVGPGQRYGFRVHGPWAPQAGHLCHPAKLLLDPYAKAIDGEVRWHPAVFPFGDPDGSLPNEIDSAPYVPRSVVVATDFDWGSDRPPAIPAHESIVYELHVKGITARHPEVPPELRGTYAGLTHPAALAHLKRLGVTALELMPVHQFIHDKRLVERGLRNYWGYNPIGYFAPHNGYSSGGVAGAPSHEFKQMVKTLHQEGFEVILDVVYNHTAEADHQGPLLCFKGFDNAAYYRLLANDRRLYLDYTGTGNTLDTRHPQVLQLVMDSLRYWILEMHVDGFRFDLAPALARGLRDVDRVSAFFDLIHQDPVVRQVKLIAEPWDVGEGGYQVGNFPPLWSEWNGEYRDTVRDVWRGGQTAKDFAERLTGSPDLYATTGRRPSASVNFVTCHDGFTLRDLVSYDEKHNEANGEGNRDGESHNRSWNCGVEGPTSDPEINALRARQQRNLLLTLLVSQGIPMLLGGDELGRTQGGNNNPYCQDNETAYTDWEHVDTALLAWTADLVALRRRHPILHLRHWLRGRAMHGDGLPDVGWYRPDGAPMGESDWLAGGPVTLVMHLDARAIAATDARGEPVVDDSFLLLINASGEAVGFRLPGSAEPGAPWQEVCATAETTGRDGEAPAWAAGEERLLIAHSARLLESRR